MPKKKYKKAERRKKEVIKAQTRGARVSKSKVVNEALFKAKSESRERYKLNTKAIKTDLFKTGIFIIVVGILLIALKELNLQFDLGIYK